MGRPTSEILVSAKFDINEGEFTKIENFREQVIKFNSIHGSSDTVEWFRTMPLEKLVEIHYKAILAKIVIGEG